MATSTGCNILLKKLFSLSCHKHCKKDHKVSSFWITMNISLPPWYKFAPWYKSSQCLWYWYDIVHLFKLDEHHCSWTFSPEMCTAPIWWIRKMMLKIHCSGIQMIHWKKWCSSLDTKNKQTKRWSNSVVHNLGVTKGEISDFVGCH